MLLSEYQAQLSTVIDRYSRIDLLVSCEISGHSIERRIRLGEVHPALGVDPFAQ